MKIDYLAEHPDLTEQAAEIMYNEWHHVFPNKTKEILVENFNKRLHESHMPLCGLMPSEGLIQGMVSIIPDQFEGFEPGMPWLSNLWVRPKTRYHYLGTNLVYWTLSRVKSLGFDTCYLATPVNTFFKKLGWKTIDTIEENGYPLEVMVYYINQNNND